MKKYIPSDTDLDKIINLYTIDKLSAENIGKEFGVSKPTMNKILKDNNIPIRSSGQQFKGGKSEADKRYMSKPENKERRDIRTKEWAKQNRDKLRDYHGEWRDKNRENLRRVVNLNRKKRRENDPIYKLISYFKTAHYIVLKENNIIKRDKYFNVLPYTQEELINHITSLFTEGMTLENYGEWHLDHKLPISSFNIKEMGDAEFMKCWSLENLQPLWAFENLSKNNKIIY